MKRLAKHLTPERMLGFHVINLVGWTIMLPVAFITGLAYSVAFVTVTSIWALSYAATVGISGSLAHFRIDNDDV